MFDSLIMKADSIDRYINKDVKNKDWEHAHIYSDSILKKKYMPPVLEWIDNEFRNLGCYALPK